MRTLEALLQLIPGTFGDLEGALVPAISHRGDGGTRGDAFNRPAPARLDVIEHRHLLVRGLRWWVDAVAPNPHDRPTIVGGNVAAMCRLLASHLEAMDPEDRDTMHQQLDTWYGDALDFRGAMAAPEELNVSRVVLPPEAPEQRVRVADAATILGVSVRTIQRRVPEHRRLGGYLRLGDAMERCEGCDLYVGAGCACALTP